MKLKKSISIILIMVLCFCATLSVLAAGNMAYSVGTSFNKIDTTAAASYAADAYSRAGYSSNLSQNPSFDDLNGYFGNGIRKLESTILFISGHGSPAYVETSLTGLSANDWNSYIGDKKLVGAGTVNWGTTSLVTLGACQTAEGGNSSIAGIIRNKGAFTTVGWTTELPEGSFKNWAKRYSDNLANGQTVYAAITNANNHIYLDNRVKNTQIFGNQNLVIRPTRSIQNAVEHFNIIDIDSEYSYTNVDELTNYLETIITNFNKSDYIIDIAKSNNETIIDFVYKIGNYRTLSGYTVRIKNDKVIQVIDNTIPINNEINVEDFSKDINEDFKEDILEESYQKVKSIANNICECETELQYFYDIENNTKNAVVSITSKIDNAKYVHNFTYLIK